MASRLPKQLVAGVQLGASAASYYGVPANTSTTISAFTLNNTTATPRTVTIHVVASGGTASAANQIATTIGVPAAGSPPTVVYGLVGQTLPAGATIQMLADAATAVTPLVSGYEVVA